MKIWMYCTGLEHPAMYLQNNDLTEKIFLSPERETVNMRHGIPIIYFV